MALLLLLLKHGFIDVELWASLFLGEEVGLPLGSDTPEFSAASLTSDNGVQNCLCFRCLVMHHCGLKLFFIAWVSELETPD